MAVKMRLRRIGAKKQPAYRVVVADARSPRDGRFIEIVGHYNPLTEPATIKFDVERVDYWLKTGAQPTDVVIRLMKKTGLWSGNASAATEEVAPVQAPAEAPIVIEEVIVAEVPVIIEEPVVEEVVAEPVVEEVAVVAEETEEKPAEDAV